GISVDHLPEQFGKIADATVQLQNGQLSRQAFLTAVKVECRETSSRAFVGQRPVEVTSGIKVTSTDNVIRNPETTSRVMPSRSPRYVGEQMPWRELDEAVLEPVADLSKVGINEGQAKDSSHGGKALVVGESGKGVNKW
ncbi:unnamed protein product, partial [Laminaria digitata]